MLCLFLSWLVCRTWGKAVSECGNPAYFTAQIYSTGFTGFKTSGHLRGHARKPNRRHYSHLHPRHRQRRCPA